MYIQQYNVCTCMYEKHLLIDLWPKPCTSECNMKADATVTVEKLVKLGVQMLTTVAHHIERVYIFSLLEFLTTKPPSLP